MYLTEKMDKVEVGAVIKHFCKKGMSSLSLKPYGMFPSHILVQKWVAEFRRWRESLDDYARSWRPNEATINENVERVHCLIMCDRRRSLCDIARQTGVSFGGSSVYLERNLRDVQLNGSPEC